MPLTKESIKTRIAAILADPATPQETKVHLRQFVERFPQFGVSRADMMTRLDRALDRPENSQDVETMQRLTSWIVENEEAIPDA